MGSTELVQALIRNDLVDKLRLVIDPVMLGGGKSPFPTDGRLWKLRLVDSFATSTKAIFYIPAGA